MHVGGKVQHSGLGFLDKVGNFLVGAGRVTGTVLDKGLDVARTGVDIYGQYRTVFDPQQTTAAGVPNIYTGTPYGALPNGQTALYPIVPAAIPSVQQSSPNLDANGVKRLQQGLQSLGFAPGPVDGFFGANTENALRNFQSANNYTVDGRPSAYNLALVEGAVKNKSGGTSSVPAPVLLGGAALLLLLAKGKK